MRGPTPTVLPLSRTGTVRTWDGVTPSSEKTHLNFWESQVLGDSLGSTMDMPAATATAVGLGVSSPG
eukprot:10167297-Lingulodinium_polyedra.AAC.1